LGSDYKNDSTLSLLSISTLTESRFTIIPRTFAFALILTYLLPTLTRLSTPLAVCDHFFYYHFSSDYFISPELSVELFLAAISDPATF
jgi:hypothetical protein